MKFSETTLLPLALSLCQALSLNSNQAPSEVDSCASVSNKTVFSYAEAIACYSSFPLDSSLAKDHISSIRKTLPFYAFSDIAKRSPNSQVPSNYDYFAGLDKIEQANYKTELEFHTSLTRWSVKGHDGHTSYISNCFNNFAFRQPFPLVTILGPNGNQVVKVLSDITFKPEWVKFWNDANVDVSQYFGAEVLLIDGQLPLDYLQNFADNVVGVSRDANSRLNLALARPIQQSGAWGLSYGSHAATTLPPTKGSITYTFKIGDGEKKVEVPYLVTGPVGYTTKDQFYNKFCTVNPALSNSANVQDQVNSVFEKQEVKQIVELKPDQALTGPNRRLENPLNTPLTPGLFVQSHLVNNSTGVLVVPSFSPANANTFFRELRSALTTLKTRKVTNLIIDISNNGGGTICYGYWLKEYLFPSSKLYFPTDFKESPLFNELAKASEGSQGFYDPLRWLKPDGKSFTDSQQFLTPRKFVRGDTEGSYTQLFTDNCPNNPLKDLIQANHNLPPFSPENITIVSNGICYSTCTLFTTSLKTVDNVKTVTVGGVQYRDATYSSLGGGTVYQFASLLNALDSADLLTNKDSPQPFKFKASLSFTARQAYAFNGNDVSDTPMEFTWFPADKRLSYNQDTVTDPYKVWKQIAALK